MVRHRGQTSCGENLTGKFAQMRNLEANRGQFQSPMKTLTDGISFPQALREKGGDKDGTAPETPTAAAKEVAAGGDLVPALPKLEIGAVAAAAEEVPVKVDDKGDAETPKEAATEEPAADAKASDTPVDDAKASKEDKAAKKDEDKVEEEEDPEVSETVVV